MVVQGENIVDEVHKVLQIALSVQAEVKGLRDDQADMAAEMRVIKEFMVRTMTLEQDRNLPAKIEDQAKRITAIESREAEFRGQITMLKVIGGVLTFVSTVLAVWLAIKEIAGK